MYFRLKLSLLKTLQGECKIQVHMDMECILDCIISLENSTGRVWDTVPQGYGMFFILKLSLVENFAGGV